MDDYISKPIDSHELYKKLFEWLAENQAVEVPVLESYITQ